MNNENVPHKFHGIRLVVVSNPFEKSHVDFDIVIIANQIKLERQSDQIKLLQLYYKISIS